MASSQLWQEVAARDDNGGPALVEGETTKHTSGSVEAYVEDKSFGVGILFVTTT